MKTIKLKNKKTGLGGRLVFRTADCFKVVNKKGVVLGKYKTIAELNDEWEVKQKSKKYWHIFGTNVTQTEESSDGFGEKNKEIGNYFETREEAELAVRKLKAWKRLKDKGFRFTAWKNGILLQKTIAGQVRYEFPIDNKDDIEKDLDLLFSQEDD